MKIALINENSQAAKNEIIYTALNKVATKYGHTVDNYGMTSADDKPLTYVQNGLLAAILINSGAADFVVTGCGTGEGALLALNSFPGVICGYVVEPSDAYLFGQINDGNAIAQPFAKGFGWGAELNLENVYENLFKAPFGGGYPKERVVPEQRNKKILDGVKKKTYRPILDILKDIDKDFLLETIDRPTFKEYFYKNAKNQEIIDFVNSVLK
ncbi:MAG: RpiB/LacA/LacB family sugar-phosphate isomerase [Acholeplasmatales bacterium]|nr:RpiB/LacA/LacB family sugar-phosphate isomerase [Acholeplasmatales bacterium]